MILFVQGTSNPLSVQITNKHRKFKAIYLKQYIIKGVSTSGGLPDMIFANLNLDNVNFQIDGSYLRNDFNSGVPIPISKTLTNKEYDGDGLLLATDLNNINDFKIRLTGRDGDLLVYTDAAFWFVFK